MKPATHVRTAATTDLKLEVVVIPVSEVDRSRRFYESLGWRLDADFASGDDWRLVQITPPGSPCSVMFGTGFTPPRRDRFRERSSWSMTSVSTRPADWTRRRGERSVPFRGGLLTVGTRGCMPGPDPRPLLLLLRLIQ